DGVYRPNLSGLRIDGIEQRDHVLLEWVGNVGARKPRSFEGIENLRQPPFPQTINVQQVIETIDPRGRESFGKQRRRQRSHDVRSDQAKQHPALAHVANSGCARPPPRNSWAIRESVRMFGAVSSIRVW